MKSLFFIVSTSFRAFGGEPVLESRRDEREQPSYGRWRTESNETVHSDLERLKLTC